jgi:acyl carrier protein phosphodiesterase
MNFLAHLYLSGSDVDIRLGNFIGDYVKGRSFSKYPEKVQKGIILHRAIDSFTDKHESTHECVKILRPVYGRYASVVVDVVYDHILANEWKKYSKYDLKAFTRSFYFQMIRKYNLLPDTVRKFLPFMMHSNRLYSYRTLDGFSRSIEIMSSVTSLPNKTEFAVESVKQNYDQFSLHFNKFFPEMKVFVLNEFGIEQS